MLAAPERHSSSFKVIDSAFYCQRPAAPCPSVATTSTDSSTTKAEPLDRQRISLQTVAGTIVQTSFGLVSFGTGADTTSFAVPGCRGQTTAAGGDSRLVAAGPSGWNSRSNC